MTSRLQLALPALGLVGLIALAGCGSSSDSTTASDSTAAATSSATPSGGGGAATIDVADNPKLGQVLVDSQGNTVYMFEKDDEADESYCNGSCAKVWPPVTTKGQPQAGAGVSASKLTTFKRDDGSTQVVFDGHPLYTYIKDEDTEDAYGNGLDQFGAEWYGLHPSGQQTEDSGGSKDSGGGSQGGGGYSSY
jgi:predicted lipoprotein with Yx(FWY)xxD motif